MGPSTMMMASRRFETIMLSAYVDYNDYKNDRTRVIQMLKEKRWVADHPMIRTYSLDKFVIIKEFKFVPITKKILQYETDE